MAPAPRLLKADADALEVGRNYRIVYQNPVEHLPREMVASFLGAQAGAFDWSGRPDFGTVILPMDWIREIWITDKPVMAPTIYRGETRVF